MSGSTNDKNLQLLLENIAAKLNSSAVLNGGFDRMMISIEHIEEKQKETNDKVNKIHDGLYDPEQGLYARVKAIETNYTSHLKKDEEMQAKLLAELNEVEQREEEIATKIDSETTEKLKKIAGDDLGNLAELIETKSWWSEIWVKLLWIFIGGVVGAIGKTVWETFGHR